MGRRDNWRAGGFACRQLVQETASIGACTLGLARPAPGGQAACPHVASKRPD
jgi:hypothetical protein